MSSTEKWYWALIASMIAAILIHIFPYHRFMWSYTKYHGSHHPQAGERTPIYTRVLKFFCFMIYPSAFFGLFTYVFPLQLLSDGQYCSGSPGDDYRNCKSAEDAGGDPFVFVFGSTFLMWVFDTIGCRMIGLIKRGDLSGSECREFVGQIPRIMFPRFGLTLVYCGLVCFAGSLKTRVELEQHNSPEDIDADAKLDFVERQKKAGIVAFALAAVVWSIPIAIFSHRVCTRKTKVDSSEDQ